MKKFILLGNKVRNLKRDNAYSFHNQVPLPTGIMHDGTQMNEIWQINIFHLADFEKMNYFHHNIHTFLGLCTEMTDSIITHLLEAMALMGTPA